MEEDLKQEDLKALLKRVGCPDDEAGPILDAVTGLATFLTELLVANAAVVHGAIKVDLGVLSGGERYEFVFRRVDSMPESDGVGEERP